MRRRRSAGFQGQSPWLYVDSHEHARVDVARHRAPRFSRTTSEAPGVTMWSPKTARVRSSRSEEITFNAETAEPAEKNVRVFSASSASSAFNVVFLLEAVHDRHLQSARRLLIAHAQVVRVELFVR